MADETKTKGRLKREDYEVCIDASMYGETPDWYWVGDDVEDMTKDLNPSVTSFKNIKGETRVTDEGNDPSLSVDTFYADPGDKLYSPVRNIAMNNLTGDDCKTRMLEILIDKTEGPYDAWQEDCLIKPQSIGGPTSGVNIPFNVHPCGNRVQGTAVITNGVVTFTSAANG